MDIVATEEGVLTFTPSQDIASRDIPLFVSGRALPDVPPSHRVMFQLVPLKVVRGAQVRAWLSAAFERQNLEIIEDPDRNALLLKGTSDMLARALAMIDVLDQPLLRGRYGVIIEPVFLRAQSLVGALNEILHAEGYQASIGTSGPGGSIILLALPDANKMVAFAADQATLDHVEEWARILDSRRKEAIDSAVFTYEVLNTQANELIETLNRMFGAGLATAERTSTTSGDIDRRQEALPSGQSVSSRIVVDKNRNMLLFRGSGKEWEEIRSVIETSGQTCALCADRSADRRSHAGRSGEDRSRVFPQKWCRRLRSRHQIGRAGHWSIGVIGDLWTAPGRPELLSIYSTETTGW